MYRKNNIIIIISNAFILFCFIVNIAQSNPPKKKRKKDDNLAEFAIGVTSFLGAINTDRSQSTTTTSELTPYRELAEQIVKQNDPQWQEHIDEESWELMARGLKFSGIETIERATTLNLRLCLPAPVFHTWAAIKKTTLFDGKNHKLNYVKQIEEQASKLAKQKIPVLLVYSKYNLTKKQCDTMESNFSEHPNIVTLQLEEDLGYKDEEFPWLSQYYNNKDKSRYSSLQFMDSIRLMVAKNPEASLKKARKKATDQGKNTLSGSIESLGLNRILYMDIDNKIYDKIPYMLASNGVWQCCYLGASRFPINGKCYSEDTKKLSKNDKKLLDEHHSKIKDYPQFIGSDIIMTAEGKQPALENWNIHKARELYDYLTLGEGFKNHDYLVEALIKKNPERGPMLSEQLKRDPNNSCFFDLENSALYVTQENAKNVVDTIRTNKISITTFDIFHSNGRDKKGERDDDQRISLSGIQQMRMYAPGHDLSWVKPPVSG